jgi:hypothetical protein
MAENGTLITNSASKDKRYIEIFFKYALCEF